ncbi:zinc finger BED domain-containing protein 1-like [Rhizophagus clarus]|uniref:Zinc finger BED domain-containing protein 1-like n=1 Tax=Rhizophagus clarus TaxID=94130 RepID=A0A8H3LXH6_9GLOM|nr:zinc finger BED domain-containing protein 1-like [Rhizophagus clarus]
MSSQKHDENNAFKILLESGGYNQNTCKKGGSKPHSWLYLWNYQNTKIEDLTLNQPQRKQMKLDAYAIDVKQQQQVQHQQSTLKADQSKQGFLGVICHYIIKDFELKEIILAIKYLQYPHTANQIQETLKDIINQWSLKEKIFFCISDNATMIGKGLLPAEILIVRVKHVINFFSTPKQSERLITAQKDNSNDLNNDLTKESCKYFLHIITDVDTRWSSTYFAWKQLILLKSYINNMLSIMTLSRDAETKKDLKLRLRSVLVITKPY